MTSQTDIEELKNMQREAERHKAERKSDRQKASKTGEQKTSAGQAQSEKPKPTENGQPSETETEHPVSGEDNQAGEVHEQVTEQSIQDIADQIETAVKNMDEIASERPVMTLLAAFTLGIIVGQIFSRR